MKQCSTGRHGSWRFSALEYVSKAYDQNTVVPRETAKFRNAQANIGSTFDQCNGGSMFDQSNVGYNFTINHLNVAMTHPPRMTVQ